VTRGNITHPYRRPDGDLISLQGEAVTITNGHWVHFASLEEARVASEKPHHYRVRKIHWEGPGWYYITKYEQRCPRNCCYDDVIKMVSAKARSDEVADEIRELAGQLREARERVAAAKTQPTDS
jgi:hypothetical protein